MNHTLRKRIRHQVLNGVTFFLVAVNLIPIAWMAYCGFKDNNEILSGSVMPGRRANDMIHLEPSGEGFLAGATDGGLTLFDRNLKTTRHVNLGTFSTSYYRDGEALWVLSSNKGLLRVDPATLEVTGKHPVDRLAELYGEAWKTLWVNDVRGSSLSGADGTLYFSFDFKDYPGLTAFDTRTGSFRKVDAFSPKDMGTVRFLARAGDSLAIGTRQGVAFLRLQGESLGRIAWAGEGLPDAPDRLLPLGANRALLALGDRACLFDFSTDSLKAWLPDAAGTSRIASLAVRGDRLWLGNSQAAYSLPASDSLVADAAGLKAFAPASTAQEGDLTGTKVSAILPLDNGALLGGPRGALALLSADGATKGAGAAPPASFNVQWRNYVDLWRNVDFGLYLKNSLIICGSVMLIAVLMASLGGYALARFNFPGKTLFGHSILATQMIPGIMLLLPVYLMFVNFTHATGIVIKGTYGGLILTYAAYFTPFSIWILRGFFASIPKELEEAALIDGCGPFKAFFRIIIPSAMPGIVATGVYVFLAAWDELMFAWVLTNESTYTIPVGIRLFVGNFQNRYDLMMAAATVATIPVMILFFVLQKQIVSGLTAGAVKD